MGKVADRRDVSQVVLGQVNVAQMDERLEDSDVRQLSVEQNTRRCVDRTTSLHRTTCVHLTESRMP